MNLFEMANTNPKACREWLDNPFTVQALLEMESSPVSFDPNNLSESSAGYFLGFITAMKNKVSYVRNILEMKKSSTIKPSYGAGEIMKQRGWTEEEIKKMQER